MPNLGEIKRGYEIGQKGSANKYMWCICPCCGKKRWVEFKRGLSDSRICRSCSLKGDRSPSWKGGRWIATDGYVSVVLPLNDFFSPMGDKSHRVLEHRLIMAKYLNRCLLAWEVVHHRNGVKGDNRLENLELLSSRGKHNIQINKYILKLERENTVLREENAMFKRTML